MEKTESKEEIKEEIKEEAWQARPARSSTAKNKELNLSKTLALKPVLKRLRHSTCFEHLRTSSQTLLTPVQVKEELLEQAWSLLMDDPCDVEMQNGSQEATVAEEKGEDWGEDWGEMGEEENCEVDPLVEESGC